MPAVSPLEGDHSERNSASTIVLNWELIASVGLGSGAVGAVLDGSGGRVPAVAPHAPHRLGLFPSDR
jgi:hypothetical protein